MVIISNYVQSMTFKSINIVIENHDPQHIITYNSKDTQRSYEKIMENVRLNIEYDLLLQKSKSVSDFKNNERENNSVLRPTDHIYFVVCNSCYWCASYFGIDKLESFSQVLSCHVCNSHNTEVIPISPNEPFRIKYNITRGMEMEFYRNNEIVGRPTINEQHQVPIYF
jgi:hypothetical protein